MIQSTSLTSAISIVKTVFSLVFADARLRALLGAGVSAAVGVVGLHVSGDTLLSVIAAGAALAAVGPHGTNTDPQMSTTGTNA